MNDTSRLLPVILILICGFILISGCFSIPQLGINVDNSDNRSRIIPFYGVVENETTGVNNTPIELTAPKEGLTVIDFITIIVVLIAVAYVFIKILFWILREIKLEDQPPLVP